jgi:hypothetical protein
MTRLFAALALLVLPAWPATAVEPSGLRVVQLGRFAHFLDLASVAREGDRVSLRALMVGEVDLPAGDQLFWGGWSYMDIDCGARTADLTGFQSIRVGGVEGPRTADARPGWPIAGGSLEAALADAACDGRYALERPAARDVSEAVRWGRAWLAE